MNPQSLVSSYNVTLTAQEENTKVITAAFVSLISLTQKQKNQKENIPHPTTVYEKP